MTPPNIYVFTNELYTLLLYEYILWMVKHEKSKEEVIKKQYLKNLFHDRKKSFTPTKLWSLVEYQKQCDTILHYS